MFKKFKKTRIYSLLQILFFIALCFCIGAGAAYIKHQSDPTDVAVAYFRAFLENDYEEMFSYVEKGDNHYIDKDKYIENMKTIRNNMKIDSYEILDPKKENGKYVVEVECKDLQHDLSEHFVIRLNKIRKGIKIIPDYKIDISQMFVKNITFKVPKGYQLFLNNKAVTNISVTTKKQQDIYTVDGMINGNYKATAEDTFSALEKEIDLIKSNAEIEIDGNKYTASATYKKLIEEHSSNYIKQFNKAVINRDSKRKKLLNLVDKKIKNKVSDYVASGQEIVYWPDTENVEDYKVSEIKLSDFNIDIEYDAKNKKYVATYKYSYDYKSETSTQLYTSYVYIMGGTCDNTVKFTYKIDGDKALLADINMKFKNTKTEDNSLLKPSEY